MLYLPVKNSIFLKFGFFWEKLSETFFCFFERIFIVKYSVSKKIFIADEFFPKENKINGGSNDKELNEFTVLPYILLFFLAQTTVIPVVNLSVIF